MRSRPVVLLVEVLVPVWTEVIFGCHGCTSRCCRSVALDDGEYADLALKEQALAKAAPIDSKPGRYRPPDKLLAFLEAL